MFLRGLAIVLASAALLGADGLLIPEPPFQPLCIKYHRVRVEVEDQAAQTEIDQVFLNDEEWDMEGTYIFPLPVGASFSAFSMHVDGEPLTAEILDAQEARQIYEEIVRQRIDPALLEYVGQGAYRARVFPIPAKGEKRIELAYDEVLVQDAGIVRYLYPLNTEKFSPEPLEDVSVRVDIRSSTPIKAVYSPSHEIVVERHDDYYVTAIYADEGVTPTEDFVLYYTVSPDEVGIDMLTYLSGEDEDGFYMLLAAPEIESAEEDVIPKRMILVFDRSGSMAGDMIEQARAALKFAVENLDSDDEFNIVDYSTSVSSFADEPVAATAETRTEALAYIDDIEAIGGTHIHGALMDGLGMMRGDERAEMLVFLTDGKPTIGVTEVEEIVSDVTGANAHEARVFVFGVGNEVNTHLLDRLADDNGGTSFYVKPGEDIEVAVSSFYMKVSSPVLADLELEITGAQAGDFYPQSLPDLFRGAQLVQLGRLDGQGEIQVRLSGQVLGETRTFERTVDTADGGPDFLPRLWATRKVGFLLDQIRLHGEDQELVDEIVALSKRFGIITPYTSFLIVEDEPPVPMADDPTWRNFVDEDSGADAVAASEGVGYYKSAGTTREVRSQEVRYVGDKTFYLRADFWRDSSYDPDTPARRYRFGSDAYFQLVASQPEMGRFLALGKNVEVLVGGEQYRIGETEIETKVEGESSSALPELPRLDQNFPNPFNSSTTIRYRLAEPGRVTLEVFDLKGQQVRTLVQAYRVAGSYEVSWDGRDRAGDSVATGVYLARLRVPQGSQVRKLLLAK